MSQIPSTFSPPPYLRSSAAQTITPSLFRRLPSLAGQHELLELPDGDFLELHWHNPHRRTLAILTHGLEGSMESGYVLGLAHALSRAGVGVLRWNMRGCGAMRNRLPSWYHSGQSEDLAQIVSLATARHSGDVVLVGISIGGNITLKYLGESAHCVSPHVRASVVISVPMDLAGSAAELAKRQNSIYMSYLLRPLRRRMREKASRFPQLFDISGLSSIRTFHEFDARFTAPFHGFQSVEEYWEKSSSLAFLDRISTPTLIITALDDPFLSPRCIPYEAATRNSSLILETPPHGGHVGFIDSLSLGETWLDRRVVEFTKSLAVRDR